MSVTRFLRQHYREVELLRGWVRHTQGYSCAGVTTLTSRSLDFRKAVVVAALRNPALVDCAGKPFRVGKCFATHFAERHREETVLMCAVMIHSWDTDIWGRGQKKENIMI